MELPRADAILFDLGGTLRRTTKRDDRERQDYAGKIRQLLASPLAIEEFTLTLSERYRAYRQWAEKTLIELDEEQLWTQWMAPDYPADRVRALAQQLNRAWRDATGTREVYPETVPVIQELNRRGYPLGVVSNTISRTEIPLALEDTGLSSCFRVVLLSSVFGKRKPDPAILLAAAEILGVPPACCAYIGNRVDRDVVGARRAGFACVVIVHHGHHHEVHPSTPEAAPDRIVHDLRELLELFPQRG